MNEYDACEEAFKRGYEKAVKEFAERVKDERDKIFNTVYSNYHFGKEIDQIAKEMGVEL